jgi:ELWxxDGT repeat protein
VIYINGIAIAVIELKNSYVSIGDGIRQLLSNQKPEFNGWFYFPANDGVKGAELWRTDGTTNGTQIFMDINPGAGSSDPNNFQVATIQVNPTQEQNHFSLNRAASKKANSHQSMDGRMKEAV